MLNAPPSVAAITTPNLVVQLMENSTHKERVRTRLYTDLLIADISIIQLNHFDSYFCFKVRFSSL